MTSARRRRLTGAFAAAAIAATGLALTSGTTHAAQSGRTLDIQLLSFNDFHGNLEPPAGSSGRIVTGHFVDTKDVDKDGNTTEVLDQTVNAGGVEYLATHLKQLRKDHPRSLTVAAGDLIGASPFLSAAFHDEPTIEAMNKLQLDVSAVGNHEFDEGYKELQRMADGGCLDDGDGVNNQDSCPGGKTFDGAHFPYLAANVFYQGTNDTILPAYTVKNVQGAKIGFIGMTLRDTPTIVTASGVAGLEFRDEVATANALVPVLQAQGVNAIIVLLHQGGTPTLESWQDATGKSYKVNPNYKWACEGGSFDKTLAGDSPILSIAENLSPAIDMIVSGHTHQPYVCDVPDPAGQPRLVTSASSFGRLITETDLAYDTATNDIERASVKGTNVIVTRDVKKDASQTDLINTYKALSAPIASKVIGSITTDVTRTGNAAGESQLGDLIADAQLADPSVVTGGVKPVVAFMNPGGIRGDLTYANSPWGEAPGDITFEEAFTVQPFNNYLVSLDMTGAQIKTMLNQQWSGNNAGSAKKILQVSNGFAYTYSGTTLGEVTLNGSPIADATTYRVVTNNFVADGGDNFTVFKATKNKYFGGLDIDAFANYLGKPGISPYTPGPLTRITAN
jgi:5'-nucleotidase